MLSKLKISQKVYFLGAIQFLLMLVLGGISYTQMNKIGEELIDIAEQDIPLSNMVTLITEHQLQLSILFERSLLKASLRESNIKGAEQEFSVLKSEISQLNKKTGSEFDQAVTFINQSLNKLHSEKAKTKYRALLKKLQDTRKEYQVLTKEINETLERTNRSTVYELHDDILLVEKHEDQLSHHIIDVLDEIQSFTLAAALQAEEDEKMGITLIGYLFVVSAIIGAVLPFIISKSISRPINELKDRLVEISQGDGDLTLTLDERGKSETAEVAKAFNHFLKLLQETIKSTNQQASDLENSSALAMEVMQTTLSNIEKQQMETEMVSSAVHEMSSSTADVANNAQSATVVTEGVRDKVLQGKDGAVETQKIIQRLAEEIDEAGRVIESLVSETNNIGNVLENIQGIAEQTNLLALNAAIEAARAGESGRGFAVVADEVRTLAQRTQTSTLDIQSLVGRLQEEARNAVSSMQKGTSSASECLIKSDEAAVIFEDAAIAVNEISDLNVHIATASNQQSTVAEEVNRNLINITQIANETTDSAKETSEVNGDIARRLAELYANLNKFKV